MKILYTICKNFFVFGIWIVLFGIFQWWGVFAITDPAVKYPWLDLYLEDPALVWETPEWFMPSGSGDAPEDIWYWKSVLPYPQDRNEDVYLVIPGLWLITPVVDIPEWSRDYTNMFNGREIAINNYLQNWIIEYPWSPQPWYEWLRVDFWHSNYLKNDPWRYKTIFANLMRLDPGDEVWYYVRTDDGSYDLRKYDVTASYPTDPSNVDILLRDGQWADALIFWCYNGIKGRWIIEATYRGVSKGGRAGNSTYLAIPRTIKNRVDSAINVLRHLSIDKRKYEIIVLYNGIKRARAWLDTADIDYDLKEQLLSYLEDKLAGIYPQN